MNYLSVIISGMLLCLGGLGGDESRPPSITESNLEIHGLVIIFKLRPNFFFLRISMDLMEMLYNLSNDLNR